jgi:hypothetical protein
MYLLPLPTRMRVWVCPEGEGKADFLSQFVQGIDLAWSGLQALVMERQAVHHHYLRGWFVLDLLAGFPLDLIIFFKRVDMLRLPCLLKIIRLMQSRTLTRTGTVFKPRHVHRRQVVWFFGLVAPEDGYRILAMWQLSCLLCFLLWSCTHRTLAGAAKTIRPHKYGVDLQCVLLSAHLGFQVHGALHSILWSAAQKHSVCSDRLTGLT